MERQQVLSTDQLRLQVDAFARYRIVDPLRMYVSARDEDAVGERLKPILGSALRNELGRRPFAALLSPERGEMMQNIKTARVHRLCRGDLLCSCAPALTKRIPQVSRRNSMFSCELVNLRFGLRPHLFCKRRRPVFIV